MSRVELLAPAGNLNKLKIAILYGADAVYFGGKNFSLRARANNFSLEDIKEASEFAHLYNKKVYVTMNVLPHNIDYDKGELDEYLKYLEEVKIDGIIVSSMYICKRAKEIAPSLELHLSTQLSTTNSLAIKHYASLGVKRVVLAREVSINEIKKIKEKTDIGLEAFIYGSMCSAYSGRCMLSNYLVNRDANRGGCAHSCRWNYDLIDDSRLFSKTISKKRRFNIASKDLCSIEILKDIIDSGVESLKIEGRMKSEYYIATVVRCYRMLIDEIESGNTDIDYDYYRNEIVKAENRPFSIGFLLGDVTVNEQLYDSLDHPTKEFVGVVLDYDDNTRIATIEQRNYFKIGDTLEFFGPNIMNTLYVVNEMKDENGLLLDVARHPKQIIKLTVDFKLSKDDMIRKARTSLK